MHNQVQSPSSRAILLIISLLVILSLLMTGCGTHGSPDGVHSYEFDGYRGNEFKKLPDRPRRMNATDTAPSSDRHPLNLHTNVRMEWSPALEQQLTAVEGIEAAHVILTEGQAYAAVELENVSKAPVHMSSRAVEPNADSDYTDMPASMQQTIVGIIKQSADPAIQHVFVSANEQFVAEMKQLRMLTEQGAAMDAQVQELNRKASHYFPNLEGTGAYPGSIGSGQVSRPRGGGDGMYSPSTGVRQK